MELGEEELGLRYQVCASLRRKSALNVFFGGQSFCDPRLNFEQSLGKSPRVD
jgi:hypothetical protein